MKLNRTQIKAIAYKIIEEKRKENQDYNTRLQVSNDYIHFENTLEGDDIYIELRELVERIQQLPDEVKASDSYSFQAASRMLSSYVSFKKRQALPTKSTSFDSYTIENKIVLATIEVDNIEELINNIKAQL